MKKETEFKAIKKLRKKLIWTTSVGDDILISNMEKSHIQNTIIYLSKKQEECDKYDLGDFELNNMTANEWIEIFRDELNYRNKYE